MRRVFIAKISDGFFATASIAAIEAYVIGDGRGTPKLETHGHVFGSIRTFEEEIDGELSRVTVAYLEHFTTTLSAKRAIDAVEYEMRARAAAAKVASKLIPHAVLLGDIHTHPCRDFEEVKNDKQWGFSGQDIRSFCGDDELWEMNSKPLMAVIAICKMGSVHHTVGVKTRSDGIWEYNIGEYRLWLNVNFGYIRGKKRIVVDGLGEEDLHIIDSGLVNRSKERLLPKG